MSLSQPDPIDAHGAGWGLDVDRDPGLRRSRSMPARDVLEQRSEIRGHAAHRETAAVGASEDQEILGEPDEMVGLFCRAPQRRAQLIGAPFAGESQVELRLQDRERGPQLVARVVDETTLGLDRRLDPVEEVVHRRPEPGDLIIGRREGQTAAEIGRRDGGRLAPHALDRRQRGARQPPCGERQQEHRDGHPDPERDRELQQLIGSVLERDADDHDGAARRGLHRGGEQPADVVDAGKVAIEERGVRDRSDHGRRKHRCPSYDGVRADDLAGGVGDLCERLIGLDEPGTHVDGRGPAPPSVDNQDRRARSEAGLDRVQQIGGGPEVDEHPERRQRHRRSHGEDERQPLPKRERRPASHHGGGSRHP